MSEPAITTSWLSARLGVNPASVDAMRRSGRLVGVRLDGEYVYPAWQFDADGTPLRAMERVLAAARGRGLSDERLVALMDLRMGLTGSARLVDALREGRVDHVVETIRSV